MSERLSKPEGISDEVWGKVIEMRKVLGGETTDEVPDIKGETEFDGTVLDENKVNERERQFVFDELSRIFGPVEELVVKAVMVSSDQTTRVEIFDREVGDDGYLLSRWKGEEGKHFWVIWPGGQYGCQLFGDEETEAPFHLTEGKWE